MHESSQMMYISEKNIWIGRSISAFSLKSQYWVGVKVVVNFVVIITLTNETKKNDRDYFHPTH